MELALIDEVMGCLPKELTLFWYFKDRYAPYLLEKELENKGPRTIGELKRSRFSVWCRNPCARRSSAGLEVDPSVPLTLRHFGRSRPSHRTTSQ